MLFFSIEHGSRMEYYSFGAWPAMALLLGSGLAHAEETASRWLLPVQRGLAALGAVAASILLLFVWKSWRLPATQGASAILQKSHPPEFYWFSMAPLLDFTSQTFAGLRTPSLLAALSLCGSIDCGLASPEAAVSSGMQCSRGSRHGWVLLRRQPGV